MGGAFTPLSNANSRAVSCLRDSALGIELPSIESYIAYQPGAADTDFARKYGGSEYVNADVRTVGEAFAAFTEEYGFQVNALYKNMVTDIVGTTHLTTVSARFKRDAIWSMGILAALDLLLKNYPEAGANDSLIGLIAADIKKDEFWMYSRYFGIGMVRIMEIVGVEMDKDEVYPVMENWMEKQLGKPS